jgi:3-mercaptopyruvate sulfurtransferase SseA
MLQLHPSPVSRHPEAHMPRTLLMSRRTVPFALVGALTALALVSGGCGGSAGTTGYSNPITTTKTASAVIDAATLGSWTDEGKVNAPLGTADRVVVVSVASLANFTSTTKKHIPDAVLLDYPNELTMTREEGLGPAGGMMLSGARMDALIQRLGIDGSTTIVLTVPRGSNDTEQFQQSVAFWTFRYWGFARDRVKFLNGGDDAWDVAGRPLTDAILVPTPSTYSVTGNKVVKDMLRISVGEMLTFADSVNKDRSVLNTWQMLDVRGYTTTPYIANVYRGNGGFQLVTDRVNGEAARNRLYPDAATLITRMAASPVLDGAANTFLSPNRKMLVMCGGSTTASATFVLFDAVLAVPEGNITMYDGSSSQWNNYSMGKIKLAGATDAQAGSWAFDAVTPGTSALRVVGTMPAAVPGENPFVPGNFVFAPSQSEVNQIETADKAYMAKTSGGSTTPGGGGSTGGGC